MSSASQRPLIASASFAMLSLSVRSSGAIVAAPPASWIRVLDRFEPGRGARGQDDVRALGGERFGGRGADAPAGARDERQLAFKRARHQATRSASRASWSAGSFASWSVRRVG